MISAIVVHYRTPDLLRRSLPGLRGFGEVVVVDNASGDGTPALVEREFPWARLVVAERNLGFGAGANLGIKASSGDAVLLLNPDCAAQADTPALIENALARHPALWVGGCRLEAPDGSPRLSGRRWYTPVTVPARRLAPRSGPSLHHVIDGWDRSTDRPVDWVTGTGMVVARAALDALGGFDERYFMYFEDVDVCLRAWEAGGEVWYLSDVRLHHDEARLSARGLNRALFWHIRSYGRFIRKWRWKGLRPHRYGDELAARES